MSEDEENQSQKSENEEAGENEEVEDGNEDNNEEVEKNEGEDGLQEVEKKEGEGVEGQVGSEPGAAADPQEPEITINVNPNAPKNAHDLIDLNFGKTINFYNKKTLFQRKTF
jgi:hypothetical protein